MNANRVSVGWDLSTIIRGRTEQPHLCVVPSDYSIRNYLVECPVDNVLTDPVSIVSTCVLYSPLSPVGHPI